MLKKIVRMFNQIFNLIFHCRRPLTVPSSCVATSLVVQHASDGDVGSPFPVVFVTLNDAPVNGTFVVIERAGQADFSDASVLVTIPVVAPAVQYGGEPLSQDFSAFFPGRYYYRAHVSNCTGTQSNTGVYDVS
jgi:hypothetical protein